MIKKPLVYTALLMAVAACSSPASVREDEQYSIAMDSGHTIFERGYMGQAALQYKRALERALASNNAQGIHDAGYNLATAELRQNKLDDCLVTVDHVSSALKDRDWKGQDDLNLIRSYALYGLKRWDESEEQARRALLSHDPETHEQAYTVLGLNAAATHRIDALKDAITNLTPYKDAPARDNLLELKVHLSLMKSEWPEAVSLAQKLVKAREEVGDYRAMRRALFLLARAYDKQGNSEQAQKIRQQLQDSVKNDKAQ